MGTVETLGSFIKIVVFLPFIIFLIYLLSKYGGLKLQNLQNGRYMKILDRMPISKDNHLVITKIGKKGYLMSSTQNRVEILQELSEEELKSLEESKKLNEFNEFKEVKSFKDLSNNLYLKKVITKLKIKKEDK